ncbi:hypothetical protein IKE83_02825 [Candidatus Saccharibacteria bacterium]|nr:hypothetical protein [Candidatus Saccharibacteria bacterium]
MDEKYQKSLKKELKLHAKALGIPSGAADSFISLTLEAVSAKLKTRKIVTDADIRRLTAKELAKYNKDFAYVFKNCDTII